MRAAEQVQGEVQGGEWVSFPGGELEGKRPKALCPACRAALNRRAPGFAVSLSDPSSPSRRSSPSCPSSSRPLCFQCYRAELERERALRAAGDLDTASEARFQFQLPFEPVNRARLDMLKAARVEARRAASEGIGQFVDKRRQAQLAARRALQTLAAGLNVRQLAPTLQATAIDAAIHAAELQLPDAWLPFVMSRRVK
jgi:hypothetical protein